MADSQLGNRKCAKCDSWYDANYDGCPYCAKSILPDRNLNRMMLIFGKLRLVALAVLVVAVLVVFYFFLTGQLQREVGNILFRAAPQLLKYSGR
jgi:hypothetical protein